MTTDTTPITKFVHEFAFLSNFALCDVYYDGYVYRTVEHAFQAAKTLDWAERGRIAAAHTPGSAKALGRRVALREDWETVKQDVMYQCLQSKFENPGMRRALLATGDRELIEGNTWNDTYWGVCRGKGQNNLGKLLMKLRAELRGTEA